MLDEVHDRYFIVYGVQSCRALKNAGKPWIRQSFFANVLKSLFRQSFFYCQSFLLYGILCTLGDTIYRGDNC